LAKRDQCIGNVFRCRLSQEFPNAECSNAFGAISRETPDVVDDTFDLSQSKQDQGLRGGIVEAQTRWKKDWIKVRSGNCLRVGKIEWIGDVQDIVM
jgi:hypothetical protein